MRPRRLQIVRPGAERFGYWAYALHLWTVFGLALSNACLVLAAAAAPFAARRSHGIAGPWSWLLVPAGLYSLFVLLSIAASPDPAVTWSSGREILGLGTLVLAPLLVRGEDAVRRIVDVLVAVAGTLALAGLGQLLFGFGDITNRIRGPFSHYMTLAGVLLLANLVLIAQLVYGRGRRSIWRWGALLAINLALLTSLTRGAWVALGLAATVLLLIRAPRYIALYAPAGLLLLLLAPLPMVHRVVSIIDLKDRSNYDRLCMAEAGLRMIGERPLFGLGPDMVQRRYPIYRDPTAPRRNAPHLHNTFLQIAAEKGLPALAAYLWLMGACLWLTVRRYRQEGGAAGPRADLYMGVGLALLAFNVGGLFEANWRDSEVQRVALFLLAVPFLLEGPPAAQRSAER